MLSAASSPVIVAHHHTAPFCTLEHSKADLNLCAVCHRFRPFRRQWTIPAVLDTSILYFPRSVARMQCQKSILRSRVSSSELDMISHIEIARAHLSSREIAMSTSDAASEWRSVESEVWRYPQRPGSSSFDDVVENGDIWCMGSRWGY